MDLRVLRGADELHLPQEPSKLVELSDSNEVAPLAAALVRVTIDSALRDAVLADNE